MTDQEFISTPSDQAMDELLRKAFGKNHQLSDEFEDKVMSTIHTKVAKSNRHKVVMIAMMIYWTAASMIGAWLLLGSSGNEETVVTTGTLVLWPVLMFIAFGLYFIVRQASFRLSDLFLHTIQ